MQPHQTFPLTLSEAQARLRGIVRVLTPSEVRAKIAVWTAASSDLPSLVRARDPFTALAAIGDGGALPALRKAISAKNSPAVPAHSARGAQEMARGAVDSLQRGNPQELPRDYRGNIIARR